MRYLLFLFLVFTQLGFSQKKGELPNWVTNSNVKHPDFNSDKYIIGVVVSVKYKSKGEIDKAKVKAEKEAREKLRDKYTLSYSIKSSEESTDESDYIKNGKDITEFKNSYSSKSEEKSESFKIQGIETRSILYKKKIYAVAAFNIYETKNIYTRKLNNLNNQITEYWEDAIDNNSSYKEYKAIKFKIKAIACYNEVIKRLKEIEGNSTMYNLLRINYRNEISLKKVKDEKETLIETTLNLNDFAYSISEVLKDELGVRKNVVVNTPRLKHYDEKETEFSSDLKEALGKHLGSHSNVWGLVSGISDHIEMEISGEYEIDENSILNFKLYVKNYKTNVDIFQTNFELKTDNEKKAKKYYTSIGIEESIKQNKINKNTVKAGFDIEITINKNKGVYKTLSEKTSTYLKEGDKYRFAIKTNKSGYLQFIYKENNGGMYLLLENEVISKTMNEYVEIPFTLTVKASNDQEQLVYIISEDKLYLDDFENIGNFKKFKSLDNLKEKVTREFDDGEKENLKKRIIKIPIKTTE
jgi:hypothetical protein